MHPTTTTTATEDECSSTVKQLQHFVAKPEMHYSLLATDMRGSKLASLVDLLCIGVLGCSKGIRTFCYVPPSQKFCYVLANFRI